MRQTPRAMAEFAACCVGNAQAKNAAVFAYFKANPVMVSAVSPHDGNIAAHQALLDRIAPWLPRRIPRWMRPCP